MMRFFRTAALLVAALALSACPPPPDIDSGLYAPSGGAAPAQPTGDASRAPGPADGAAAKPPGPRTTAGSASGAASAAKPTSGTEPEVVGRLRGGVLVPRCPACGEVQTQDATECPGCGQKISPWRAEALCSRCVGDGRCDHCGDDRICLACDGDGACPSCGGSGKTGDNAATCFDCGGTGRCPTCRGDGRRESVAGDFTPSDGWLPGACAWCIDGSGLCPECGSSGKDPAGGTCLTCGGLGACPECGGTGECSLCAHDGKCTVCDGGGVEVVNGPPRGPTERLRTLRTSAGSLVSGRLQGPPTLQGLTVLRTEGGKTLPSTLPKSQVNALSWWLATADFPPGWDGRTAAEPSALAEHARRLADLAADSGWWPLAMRCVTDAVRIDPSRAQLARTRLQEIDTLRVEDWARRAETALREQDRDLSQRLLEMVAFKGRGTPQATRADLLLLQIRKNRELATHALSDAEKVRRVTDALAATQRALGRAKLRLERARRVLEEAVRAAPGDVGTDRMFARAAWSATWARRTVQATAWREAGAGADWDTDPSTIVTESRLREASVLAAWAARAVASGRFDLGARLARRGIALEPSNEPLAKILGEAESGRARTGVLLASPPPGKR